MTTHPDSLSQPGSYMKLMRDGRFQCFLWTQFLGSFNDNVFKMIVSILAVRIAADADLGSRYLALAGAVFVLPFLLFAGWAGQLADRFSKTRVLQVTKAFEVVIMTAGIAALLSNRIEVMLIVLFLLAVQANFFSPAKYAILPEILPESQMSRANGLLELSTFVAIVLGTSFGTWLFQWWGAKPLYMGLLLLAIAVAGSVASLRIAYAPASGSREPFHWNPVAEIWTGLRSLRSRRPIWLTIVGISVFWFLGALFQMAILLAGKETLHVSETAVGLLITALAAGIGAGSLVAGRIAGDHIEMGLVPVGSALMGIFAAALGLTNSYAWSMVWMAVIGFSSGLFIVPLNAYLQEAAGKEERGRLLATNSFVNMFGVIVASGVLWWLHDVLGWNPNHVILACGLAMLAGTVYLATIVPGAFVQFVLRSLTHSLFRVRVVGAEHIPAEGGALLVANHVSFADAFLVGCATHRLVRFVMLQRFFEWKFAKPVFQLMNAIPIPVGSPKGCVHALRAAKKEVECGELVCIFPEGGLTQTGHVGAFQRGFERIVEGTGVPVIPIYLDGLWGHPLGMKGGKVGANWSWPLRREIIVCVGEPVPAPVHPERLRQRVLALSAEAAELRKTRRSTLVHALVASARRNWNAPALADSTGAQLTFGDTLSAGLLVRDWVDRRHAGEECIGILLPSSVAGAVVNFGITLAGRTAVNLNFTAGEAGMDSAIRRCGVRTIFTSRRFVTKAKLAEREGMAFVEDVLASFTRRAKLWAAIRARFAPVRRLARGMRPDDVATVIFSSGSTGDPKGVQLSHWNLLSNTDSVAGLFPVGRGDRMMGALPFFHSFGYAYTLWFPLLHDFGTVYHTTPTDAKTIGELVKKHRATFLLSTPTFCQAYTRNCTAEQFATLRFALVGAEKLRAAVADAFREKFGVAPVEGYGCTEMAPVIAVNTPDMLECVPPQYGTRTGSVGRLIPGVSYRVVHPDTFEDVVPGDAGLLLVKGPNRMTGYFGDSRRTAEALHEGFYNTGDLVRIDPDGFVYIVDRLARISKIGGEMVPHLKVEEALSEILDGSPSVVVSMPDSQRGERLAVLYTCPRTDPGALVQHLLSRGLPPLWVPKRENFYRVDEIPMLGTGKIDLRRARAIAEGLSVASPAFAV